VIAPGLLDRELAAIREHGVAEEHEESTVGIACVAAPVLDTTGRAVAAISITGWANRLDTHRFRAGGAHRRARPVPHAARRLVATLTEAPR